MIRSPQIPRTALDGITKVSLNQPTAVFVAARELVFDQLEAIREEEGERGHYGGAALVEAAGGEACYVKD